MKLEQIKFHKSFQLNGCSFTSVDEILSHTKGFSDEIYHFLESWFSCKPKYLPVAIAEFRTNSFFNKIGFGFPVEPEV